MMTKQELQEMADAKGVKYDKRWGVPKLEAALGLTLTDENITEKFRDAKEVFERNAPEEGDIMVATADGIKYVDPKEVEIVDGIVFKKPEDTTPRYSEAEIELATAKLSGAFDKPVEEFTSKLDRETGLPTTETGILIPWEVLSKMKPTQWVYNCQVLSDKCVIERMMYNGRKEFVREYSLSVHGENFRQLAEGFVAKKNA